MKANINIRYAGYVAMNMTLLICAACLIVRDNIFFGALFVLLTLVLDEPKDEEEKEDTANS